VRSRPLDYGEDPLEPFRRFAATAVAREADPLLCRHLRSRAWSVVHPVLDRFASAVRFCCLKSLRHDGPDGGRVLPDDCTDERGCFEPADRSQEPES
jgi:hypothetical protein